MKNRFYDFALFVVESRIWIALGAVSLVVGSYNIAGFPIPFMLLICVFVGTWAMYYMQRYIPGKVYDLSHAQTKAAIVSGVVLVAGICFGLLQNPYLQVYAELLLFSLPALFYAVRFKRAGKIFSGLRQVPYIKILIVAIVWEFLVVLPWVEYRQLSNTPWAYAGLMFFYLVAIIIPFDVRDMETDDVKMRTVAQILGARFSWGGCYVLLCLSMVCDFILVRQGFLNSAEATLSAMILLSTGMILYKKPRVIHTLYYEGLLDGTLLLWGIIAIF